jgi:hypothetical protein
VILFLKILGGLGAVALGIYLGGGGYTQSQEEIEARLGVGQPRKAKRHFMWLDWLTAIKPASDRRRHRTPFKTAVPRKRDERD